MNNKYPKYYLRRKQLSHSKIVTIFRRNYLSIDLFSKLDNGWFFEEEFDCNGTHCKLKITVNDVDISKLFSVYSKTFKIKGSQKSFSLFLRTAKYKTPFCVNVKNANIFVRLDCSGKTPTISGNKEAFSRKFALVNVNSVKKEPAPVSVQWSAKHPYQGGKMK